MLEISPLPRLHDAAKALSTEVWLRHNGVNNGEISFGCSEAPALLGWTQTKPRGCSIS